MIQHTKHLDYNFSYEVFDGNSFQLKFVYKYSGRVQTNNPMVPNLNLFNHEHFFVKNVPFRYIKLKNCSGVIKVTIKVSTIFYIYYFIIID